MIFNSEEQWLEARRMRFTASEIHKLMGKSRNGSTLPKTAETYIYEKASTILSGIEKETFGRSLDWGKEYEKEAFERYERTSFEPVEYFGGNKFMLIPFGDYAGYSPDALGVDESFIVEIKCPYNSANHLMNFNITNNDDLKSIRPEYYWQMQFGMIASNSNFGRFVSYDPRMPQHKQLYIVEIERDNVQEQIETRLQIAKVILNQIIE